MTVVLVCALVTACGDAGGELATEGAGGSGRADLPEDEAVMSAIAGDEEAWVLTRPRGAATDGVVSATLWRVALGGEVTKVTTMEGSGWWLETNGSDVFAVSSGCPDGGASCDPVGVARVWVVSGSEVVVDGIEVGRREELGMDVAAHTVGTAGSDVWVGAVDRLVRVNPAGEVVEDVARGHAGLVCAVDGQLVATSQPAIPESPDNTPPTVAGPAASELDVMVMEGGEWRVVSNVALGPDEDLQCTASGIEHVSFQAPAVPVAFWTPDRDGFQPVAAGEVPAVDPAVTPVVTHHGEVLVVGDDGRAFVRPPGTAEYTARPSVRTVEGESGWKVPDYDASPTVEVSCTTETGEERSPVICEVAGR